MTHPTLELIRAITAIYYHPPTVDKEDSLRWKNRGTQVEVYVCEVSRCVNIAIEHGGCGKRMMISPDREMPRGMLRLMGSDTLNPFWEIMDSYFYKYVPTPTGLKLWEHELTRREETE